MFKTNNKTFVEQEARANGMQVVWEGKGGSATMVLVNQGPVTRTHPVTDVETWHSHFLNLDESSYRNGFALAAQLH